MYVCITSPEGREDTLRRYESLVGDEFRDRLMNLVERYQGTMDIDDKMLLKTKIAELSRRIMKCKEVWQQYTSWE